MKVDYHITEKVKRCQLLNMDMSIHKEFDTIVSAGAYLGKKIGIAAYYKPKKKPFATVKHRETKIKYYLKIID